MKIPLTPFIRIGLRYLSAVLVSKGVLDNDTGNALINDPQIAASIEIALGLGLAAIAEVWHGMALKKAATLPPPAPETARNTP